MIFVVGIPLISTAMPSVAGERGGKGEGGDEPSVFDVYEAAIYGSFREEMPYSRARLAAR